MKKVSLVTSLAFLFVLLAFTWSFAQMEKERKVVVKVMGDEMMIQGGSGGHSGEMKHQMGGCGMGQGMMHQMACCQRGSGMGMCCEMMGGGQGMGCSKMGFFLCCKKELELSDKQVKDLKSIKMDFMKGKFKADANLKIAHLELESLMDEEASLKEIETKLKAVGKLKTDMKLSHIKAFRKAKALLTPEQLEKMKKCHEM